MVSNTTPHLTDLLLLGSPHGHFIDIIKLPYVLLIYRSFQMPCIIRHAHRELASDTVTGRKEFCSLLSPLLWLYVCVTVCVCEREGVWMCGCMLEYFFIGKNPFLRIVWFLFLFVFLNTLFLYFIDNVSLNEQFVPIFKKRKRKKFGSFC